jgi:putative redox protein
LGASEGEFANTTFSSNVDDLVAAADHPRVTLAAPAILIGHSLGGAAVLAAAHRIPEARAVVTIAAPFDPAHVAGLFSDRVAEIAEKGEVEVTLAGRPFRIRRALLDNIAEQRLSEHIGNLRKALLVFHSPTDDTVGIDNASHIFTAAKHPKSFISLAGADHLLSRSSDAVYVAHVVSAWAERYLDMAADASAAEEIPEGTVLVRETRNGQFQQEIAVGKHRFLADEPAQAGGRDSGPGPYDLLLAALGACTSMTVRLYADRKQIPLERTLVRLRHEKIYAADCADCETKEGKIDHIDREISFDGQPRRGDAYAVVRDRRQMSGAPHAQIGSRHSHRGATGDRLNCNHIGSRQGRHCEERKRRAIQSFSSASGLLRFAAMTIRRST